MFELAGLLDKFSVVKQLPLFSELNFFEKSLIVKRAVLVGFKTKDLIYREGDPADAFYCIVSGRVRLFVKSFPQDEETLEYLGRGKYFGIISLLTGEVHSVTAEVVSDTVVLKIKKDDFDYILKRIPALAIDLNLSLLRRLKRKDIHHKTIFESTIISVYSPLKDVGKTSYALNLALSLKKETAKRVVFLLVSSKDEALYSALNLGPAKQPLDVGSLGQDFSKINDYVTSLKEGISFLPLKLDSGGIPNSPSLIPFLTYLANEFHYIVIDLPDELSESVFKALNHSDLIHLVTDANQESLTATNKIFAELENNVKNAGSKIKIIINELKEHGVKPWQEREKILKPGAWAVLPDISSNSLIFKEKPSMLVTQEPNCEYSKALRRVAREVAGVMVGLALGSGAAGGLAHIGVLKVFEKENITIDIISGSSMGALVAAFWATGISALEIEEAVIKNKGWLSGYRMLDLVFPKSGLIGGKKINKFLKMYLANKTFRDIRCPLKIMATNLETREEVVIEEGSLLTAVRASSAVPGIFEPVKFNGSYLIDGAVLNPVPVGVLAKLGIKKIIAVNVLPHVKVNHDMGPAKSELAKTGIYGGAPDFKRFKGKASPNIIDAIMGSFEAMEYVLADASCRQSDIYLHPEIEEYDWFDFSQAQDFIRLGEEEALKYLAEIKELIKE